ncbi:MAG: hypothetical protein JW797_17705 [Bradymonadales bacterium]|nr:hypothetical protein [Bradymonadales bacterium]
MPTYRFQVYLNSFDQDRLSLLRSRLVHRRKGTAWVQEVIDRVSGGEPQVVKETNGLADAWSFWKELTTNGGSAQVYEVMADGTKLPLKMLT